MFEPVKLLCDTNFIDFGHAAVYHGAHHDNTTVVRTTLIALFVRSNYDDDRVKKKEDLPNQNTKKQNHSFSFS